MSYLFSRQFVILLMQHAPESGYCDTEMKSSVYVLSIFPWLMAPTVNTTLTSSGSAVTYVFMSLISGALNEKPTRRAPAGRRRRAKARRSHGQAQPTVPGQAAAWSDRRG